MGPVGRYPSFYGSHMPLSGGLKLEGEEKRAHNPSRAVDVELLVCETQIASRCGVGRGPVGVQ